MNQISTLVNPALLRQLFYFGIVGTLAASVHFTIVIVLVEIAHLTPLTANIFAFICSFNISYFGHRYLTFSQTKASLIASLPRFLTVATWGFVLNEGLFYLFLKIFPYPIALLIVIILVAISTFCFSKIWAFR